MSVQSISPAALAQDPLNVSQARQIANAAENPKPESGRRSGEVAPGERVKPTDNAGEAERIASQAAPVDPKALERALENIRRVVEPVAHNLRFTVDEDTGRTVVKVLDSATDQVIRQIPSEEILSIAKALDKLSGLLLEQKA
ncbi:MAG: flagellar protein FlaG [Rhodocyclaceae bacterium]|nr:flagellar protein FlaG [Rhodocyclaceae bacterium]